MASVKLIICLAALIGFVPIVAEEGCNHETVISCTGEYIMGLNLLYLDSEIEFCANIPTIAANYKECLEINPMCWLNNLTQAMYEDIVTTTAARYESLCSPTKDCTLLNVYRCFMDYFNYTGLAVPDDITQTAAFIENYPEAMYHHQEKYCSAQTSLFYKPETFQCINETLMHLESSCKGPDSEDAISMVIGPFLQVRRVLQYILGMCETGCENIGMKIEGTNRCLRKYIETIGTPGKEKIDMVCSVVEELMKCVASASENCVTVAGAKVYRSSYFKDLATVCNVLAVDVFDEVDEEGHAVKRDPTSPAVRIHSTAKFTVLLTIMATAADTLLW